MRPHRSISGIGHHAKPTIRGVSSQLIPASCVVPAFLRTTNICSESEWVYLFMFHVYIPFTILGFHYV